MKILSLPEELVDYIKRTASKPHPPEGIYQQEYRKLGKRVYLLALMNLNRLLNYVRSVKGQYWLQEYPIDKAEGLFGINIQFNTQALIDSKWYRWFSDIKQLVNLPGSLSNENARFIEQDIWPEVIEFVTSKRRSALVWALLAGSEWLAGIGHRRSALTEAVTALEVAISDFAKRSDIKEIFEPMVTERMNVASLKKWTGRMGLSGTVNYLFPLIIAEDKLPTDILRDCQEAINMRQNVVHNGQRDVSEHKLLTYIDSIRRFCLILEDF